MRKSVVALITLVTASAAHAQDRFEIQVYDSETAKPGEVGLETHLNDVIQGTTAPSSDGELATNHLAHVTWEPHLGLAPWAELGGYLQAALSSDGTFGFGGAKLRLKLRKPEKVQGWLGLALNFELSAVPAQYEANVWGSEIRPVIDARVHRFYFSINPIVSTDLAGKLAGHPQLEPCAKAAVNVSNPVALGLEYYAGLGAVDQLLPPAAQVHRLFAAADVATSYVDLNVGIGYGFAAGERWIAKAIVGIHPKQDVPSYP